MVPFRFITTRSPVAVLTVFSVWKRTVPASLLSSLRLLGAPGGRAADMERAHGELRAGLADGLGCHDPHRLTQLDQATRGQVAAVALHADAAPGFAGQDRSDAHPIDARVLHAPRQHLDDLLVGRSQGLAGERVHHVLQRHPAQDAVAQRLDDLTALDQRRRPRCR